MRPRKRHALVQLPARHPLGSLPRLPNIPAEPTAPLNAPPLLTTNHHSQPFPRTKHDTNHTTVRTDVNTPEQRLLPPRAPARTDTTDTRRRQGGAGGKNKQPQHNAIPPAR